LICAHRHFRDDRRPRPHPRLFRRRCARIGRDFLRAAKIRIVAITEQHGDLALGAMQRFGKGRAPAAPNMGDCFGYAVAKAANVPILFVGEDFSRTDLVAAG
jgi:ribonuclease VapC